MKRNMGTEKKQEHKLTLKQEKFCQEILKGSTASDAYRAVYNCEKSKPESIWRLATGLTQNVKVASRIEELKAPAIQSAQMTVENHLRKLEEIRDAAFEAGNFTAANRAEELRGKVAGYYTDKIEIDNKIRMVVLDD